MTRPLLILDLDETLVHADEALLARRADFVAGPYLGYVRPFFWEFLASVRPHWALAVWTSSSAAYAAAVVDHLFPDVELEFAWSCTRCTRRFDYDLGEEVWIKDLRKAARRGFPLERILIIDDSPEKLRRQYGNLLRVRPWHGDPRDTELRDVIAFLQWLLSARNFRTIEKRGWRSHATQRDPR
jgi:TFIIF-interacting CTD phosphatase-like protein